MREFLSITDYFVQAVLLLTPFIYPWRIRLEQGWRVFCVPSGLAFLWGIWRVVLFDPATKNDVPGIIYFVHGGMLAVLSTFFFLLRCWLVRRRKASQ